MGSDGYRLPIETTPWLTEQRIGAIFSNSSSNSRSGRLGGGRLKVQADLSYDTYAERDPRIIPDNYNRWQLRFQIELGL